MSSAEVVQTMTPARIQEAIDLAAASWKEHRATDKGEQSRIDTHYSCAVGQDANGAVVLAFWTPFARVFDRAVEAERKYQKLRPAQIPAALLGPYIDVAVPPAKMGRLSFVSPQHVVIVDTDGKATQPRKVTKSRDAYQNAFGAKASADWLSAEFPLSALKDGSEFRVSWGGDDEGVCKIDLSEVQ